MSNVDQFLTFRRIDQNTTTHGTGPQFDDCLPVIAHNLQFPRANHILRLCRYFS